MSFGRFGNWRKDVKTFLAVLKDIFDNFLHENAIISLSGHARVSS